MRIIIIALCIIAAIFFSFMFHERMIDAADFYLTIAVFVLMGISVMISLAIDVNPTAKLADMECPTASKSPRISSRYETKDGRPVISLKYNLTAATSGKYHISGKLKIHDSMTGKNWTVSAQNDVFSTGADEDTPFLLLYAVPKELADKNITDASYTVSYASGYSEVKDRYSFSYAEKSSMHIFTDPMLKISRTGKLKDRVVSETPDEDR